MTVQATDKELGKLHKQIAAAFSQALMAREEAAAILDEHGDDLPDNVQEFLKKYSEPNPSLLTSAVKFLKDNDITCAVTDSEDLSDIQKRLKSKRRTSDNIIVMEDYE